MSFLVSDFMYATLLTEVCYIRMQQIHMSLHT